MKPTIECPRCEGRGKVGIAEPLQRTLDLVPRAWTTTKEIAELHRDAGIRVKLTAMLNRLAWLAAHGLIDRRGDHHPVEWRRR